MMDWFVKAFLKASLVWFSLAIAVALAMALMPMLTVYRTAHMHVALLGFVTQMIYGIALHVIPRFFGQPLVHRWMAEVQFWCAQAGLIALTSGFVARIRGWDSAAVWLASGGILSAVAAACFVVNLWRTMDASQRHAVNARGSALPVMPQSDAH